MTLFCNYLSYFSFSSTLLICSLFKKRNTSLRLLFPIPQYLLFLAPFGYIGPDINQMMRDIVTKSRTPSCSLSNNTNGRYFLKNKLLREHFVIFFPSNQLNVSELCISSFHRNGFHPVEIASFFREWPQTNIFILAVNLYF